MTSHQRILHHTENPHQNQIQEQKSPTVTFSVSTASSTNSPQKSRFVTSREVSRDWMFQSPDGGERELKTTYQREREGQTLGERARRSPVAAAMRRNGASGDIASAAPGGKQPGSTCSSPHYQTSNSAIGKGCNDKSILVENLSYGVGKRNRVLNEVFSSDVADNRDARRKELLFVKKWNLSKRNDSSFFQNFE
mmetsp:Transcript_8449/g.31266  ORF Transcript_8449/g.31266 Transcript_8449/m.31266 type:complete len:194 (-) Transcript_8449:329-910(-)